MDTVSEKLKTLCCFFDVDQIAHIKIDSAYINEYYKVNKHPYSLLHTKEHLVHMGISETGIYSEQDLYVQVEKINSLIQKNCFVGVLELAIGRGGNSAWLAKQNPEVQFYGVDASKTQLSFATNLSRHITNLTVAEGDFHKLKGFASESLDLVFVIEALCHSSNAEGVFSEVYRILKKDGMFVVYDGYRQQRGDIGTPEEQLLARLLEVGVAVERFMQYDDFIALGQNAGFNMVENTNHTENVLPTMLRFEKQAKLFLHLGIAAKLILRILPRKFSYNIITGFLLPTAMREGIFSYQYTTFRK